MNLTPFFPNDDASEFFHFLSEVSSKESYYSELVGMAGTGGAKLKVISILDRARNLQLAKIRDVGKTMELSEVEDLFTAGSKSGRFLKSVSPYVKGKKGVRFI